MIKVLDYTLLLFWPFINSYKFCLSMPHLRGILICWWLRTLCWAFFLTICKRLRADCIAIFCDEDDPPLVDGLLPRAAAADDGIVLVLRAGIANDWCIAVEELGWQYNQTIQINKPLKADHKKKKPPLT